MHAPHSLNNNIYNNLGLGQRRRWGSKFAARAARAGLKLLRSVHLYTGRLALHYVLYTYFIYTIYNTVFCIKLPYFLI